MSNQICPECQGPLEQQNIIHDLRSSGVLYSFREVPAKVCLNCGAVYLDAPVIKKIESAICDSLEPEEYQPVPTFSLDRLPA